MRSHLKDLFALLVNPEAESFEPLSDLIEIHGVVGFHDHPARSFGRYSR
jgi:hypothetical protein